MLNTKPCSPRSDVSATPAAEATPLRRELCVELTPRILKLICDCVRLDGLSDASAGALAGVSSARLARWKAEDEFFAVALKRARAFFEQTLLREISEACKRDGTPDWRARAWLLQHTSAEGIVTPARKAKIAAEEEAADAQKCANLSETPAAPPRSAARTEPTKLSETPTGAGHPPQPSGGKQEEEASPAQNAAILSETPTMHSAKAGVYRRAA